MSFKLAWFTKMTYTDTIFVRMNPEKVVRAYIRMRCAFRILVKHVCCYSSPSNLTESKTYQQSHPITSMHFLKIINAIDSTVVDDVYCIIPQF